MNNITQMRKPDGDSDRLWPGILWLAPVALVYFLVAHFSFSLIFKPEGITVIWPASGIFLSAVLLTRRKIRPYLVVVLFLTDFVSEMLAGTPLVASLVFSTALAGDAVLSAWLLFRYVGDPFTLRNVRQVAGFLLLSVILSNALAAVVTALIARIYLGTPFASWWFWWWSSDAVGNLLVTPVIISWAHAIRTHFDNFTILKSVERIISLVLMILLSEYAFSHFSGEHWQILLLNLVTFPFLIWAAMRFGVFGTAATSLLLAVIMIGNALAGRFSLSDYGPNMITLIVIQAYLGVMSVTALFLAATVIERQRTEVDLRESEGRYRQLAEASQDMVFIISSDGTIEYINHVAAEKFKRKPEELIGKSQKMVFPAEVSNRQQSNLRIVFDSAQPRYFEDPTTFPDGDLWLGTWLVPLKDETGRIHSVMGVSRDITERRLAEEALQSSNAFNTLILQTIPFGMDIVDPDGKILFMNQVMEKAIGKPALGKRCWLSYRDDKKQCPDCPLKQTIDVGVTRTLESVGVMGGRTYEISHTGIIYRGEKAVMEIFYDVSGRKQTELEVRRQANEFSTLYETAQNLAGMTDLPTLLQTVLQRAVALLSTTNGTIALYDPQRGNLELRAVHNFPAPVGTRRELGEGMAGMVAQTRQPLVVDDYQKWVGHVPEYNALKLNAAIEVPMIYHGDLVGTLGVGEVSSTRHFSENDVRLLSLFASLASAAVQNARLFSQTNVRLQHLSALRAIDMAISSSFDIHITLSILLDQVTKQLDVDAADVLILNQASQTLRFSAGQGFRTQALQHTDLRLGDGYAGQAVRDRQVIVIRDLTRNLGELTRSTEFSQEGFMTYVGIPLIAKGQVKGVMEIFHREPMELDPEQRAFVDMLGSQAAIAIDGSLIYENLQSTNAELIMAYDETIEGWAQAMDLRDKETEGHSLRVAEMAVRLAENLDTNLEDLIHIRRGALLHDIGKLGIPDEILLKAGPLTEEEWVSMRNHPEFANHMLAPIRYLRSAKEIPYCHHEKWDGTGYPRRLKGEQIPMAARIFAVVDVFDALTSDRPYRKAWSKEKALEHIRTSAGSHFDPQVVEAFLKLSQESG